MCSLFEGRLPIIRNLILDTNIIYYISGLSEGPISKKEFDTYVRLNNSDIRLYISGVSLFEILSKYHKHANVFRRIMCNLRGNHIGILDNEYHKKIGSYQSQLTNIKQSELNGLWKEVMENKVDVEARYSTVLFFYVLSSSVCFGCTECITDVNNIPEYLHRFLAELFSIVRDVALEVFKDAFETGYQSDDCERIVKVAFSNLLTFFLPSVIAFCNSVADGRTTDNGIITIPEKEELEPWSESIAKKIKRIGTPTGFISKLAKQYEKNQNEISLKYFLKNISGSLSTIIPNTTTQEYLFDLVVKCLTQSGVFYKNDILDAMILGTIKGDDVLLTMDKGPIKHMVQYKDGRPEYQASLIEIDSLKNGYTQTI